MISKPIFLNQWESSCTLPIPIDLRVKYKKKISKMWRVCINAIGIPIWDILQILDIPIPLGSRQTFESLCLLQEYGVLRILSPDPRPSSSLFFAPNLRSRHSYLPNAKLHPKHRTWHRQLHLRHSYCTVVPSSVNDLKQLPSRPSSSWPQSGFSLFRLSCFW